jgi:uncharacterized protein
MTTGPGPDEGALLLFPGAGSASSHSSLIAIEQRVAPMRTVRADFPYRKANRRAPDRAPVLLDAVRSEHQALVDSGVRGRLIVLGGRSMGGRICSMAVADGLPAAGLVLISYPLHPPGKPERLRVEHLPRLDMPCLFVHGTRDPFGSPDELTRWTETIPGAVTHRWIEGGRHDLAGADAEIASIVAGWISGPHPAG